MWTPNTVRNQGPNTVRRGHSEHCLELCFSPFTLPLFSGDRRGGLSPFVYPLHLLTIVNHSPPICRGEGELTYRNRILFHFAAQNMSVVLMAS
jgi:hypothetical protein